MFDLLQWQEIATLRTKLPSLLSPEQHFAGIFASEPMTLPEIDHVSFFATRRCCEGVGYEADQVYVMVYAKTINAQITVS